jgi:hypothetical protein
MHTTESQKMSFLQEVRRISNSFLIERNTIVGIDFLIVGFVLAALGYVLAQSIPIAAIGIDVAILGALILLIVPESVPKDSYKALLEDSIANIEIILEESSLNEKAYFIRSNQKEIRAFIPAVIDIERTSRSHSSTSQLELVESLSKSPPRFVTRYGNQVGLLLVPPGNEICRLSKVQEGDDLEDSLRSAIVSFSDLASSVMAVESKDEEGRSFVKINISNPRLFGEFPSFNKCLGSPLSCIASCVAVATKGKAVRLVDEKVEGDLIHTTLEIIE